MHGATGCLFPLSLWLCISQTLFLPLSLALCCLLPLSLSLTTTPTHLIVIGLFLYTEFWCAVSSNPSCPFSVLSLFRNTQTCSCRETYILIILQKDVSYSSRTHVTPQGSQCTSCDPWFSFPHSIQTAKKRFRIEVSFSLITYQVIHFKWIWYMQYNFRKLPLVLYAFYLNKCFHNYIFHLQCISWIIWAFWGQSGGTRVKVSALPMLV